MRSNLLLYQALIALALGLLLAPALPVAAGNADSPTCDPRFMTVAPSGLNASKILGINDWRQIAGDCTHDSIWFHGFYLDRVDEFVKFDRPGASSTRDFGLNDKKNMAGAYVNSANNVGQTYSLSAPGGGLTTFAPPGSIDAGDLGINDPWGIFGSCIKVGSSLISQNLDHLGGDPTGSIPGGAVVSGPENINKLDDRGRRHMVLFRCFEW
ncbi:MAG: hypothetical protein WAN11_13200 [Syntrophobacteraceae bacterium]